MVTFKVVIGTKDGKCIQKEVPEPDSKGFLGKKIGEIVKGELIGLTGYEFSITGGSDHAGFPMRKDIQGPGRKRILTVEGIGVKKGRKGQRQRKTVCGNTIHKSISQINLKVTQEGKIPLAAPKAEGVQEKQSSSASQTQEKSKDFSGHRKIKDFPREPKVSTEKKEEKAKKEPKK